MGGEKLERVKRFLEKRRHVNPPLVPSCLLNFSAIFDLGAENSRQECRLSEPSTISLDGFSITAAIALHYAAMRGT